MVADFPSVCKDLVHTVVTVFVEKKRLDEIEAGWRRENVSSQSLSQNRGVVSQKIHCWKWVTFFEKGSGPTMCALGFYRMNVTKLKGQDQTKFEDRERSGYA